MRRFVLWGLVLIAGLTYAGQPISGAAVLSNHSGACVATNGPGDPGPETVHL